MLDLTKIFIKSALKDLYEDFESKIEIRDKLSKSEMQTKEGNEYFKNQAYEFKQIRKEIREFINEI